MTEKSEITSTPSANDTPTPESGEPELKKDDFEDRLGSLPEKYRDEILRQYDIPQTKVTLLSVLEHATWAEILLMTAGTLLSIASGFLYLFFRSNLDRRRNASDDGYIWKPDQRFWRIWIAWVTHCL